MATGRHVVIALGTNVVSVWAVLAAGKLRSGSSGGWNRVRTCHRRCLNRVTVGATRGGLCSSCYATASRHVCAVWASVQCHAVHCTPEPGYRV
jgi:hypothetical protein